MSGIETEIQIEWESLCEYDTDEIEGSDIFHSSYRGWKIFLIIPNGGILGACIVQESFVDGLFFLSEGLGIDLYLEEDWHIEQCKRKVDSILGYRIPEGQLSLPFSFPES